MKCQSCNEKKGSTRCEGCDLLFCLQCMNKHHAELIQQFQQLMDRRNELKESLDTAETVSLNKNKLPCFIQIDQWEQETIERIREVARNVRANTDEIMAKNVTQIRYELEQLSANMQQQEKEGNYLENDMEEIKLQLNQLKETIQHVNEEIQVTTSDKVNWKTLIHVTKTSREDCQNSSEFFIQNEAPVERRTRCNAAPTIRYHSDSQSVHRPVAFLPFQTDDSKGFRPISSPVLLHEDSSDSDRNSPLVQSFVAPDRIVSMLPTVERFLPSLIRPRDRQNT